MEIHAAWTITGQAIDMHYRKLGHTTTKWDTTQSLALAMLDRVGWNRCMAEEKNPAAVALGKLVGRKGGKARADKLTSERRKEIAKKAAGARWAKRLCQ
jgi:hypothetical protein